MIRTVAAIVTALALVVGALAFGALTFLLDTPIWVYLPAGALIGYCAARILREFDPGEREGSR